MADEGRTGKALCILKKSVVYNHWRSSSQEVNWRRLARRAFTSFSDASPHHLLVLVISGKILTAWIGSVFGMFYVARTSEGTISSQSDTSCFDCSSQFGSVCRTSTALISTFKILKCNCLNTSLECSTPICCSCFWRVLHRKSLPLSL